jgi:hypothetical protein
LPLRVLAKNERRARSGGHALALLASQAPQVLDRRGERDGVFLIGRGGRAAGGEEG